MTAPPSHAYEFGDFRLDLAERQLLRRDGTAVPLTPRVFETLRYLVEHSGKLLGKEVLMKAVWPDCIVEENNLTQNISTLRRVFGDSPGSQRYIVTVPGHGYRFVAEVTARSGADAVAPVVTEEIEATPAREEPEKIGLDRLLPPDQPVLVRRNLRRALLTSVVIVGTGIALFSLWRARTQVFPTGSIAVLPFKPLVSEKGDQVLEIGMADTLIAKLGSSQEIVVRPLSSVRKYGGLEQDPLAAGRELSVTSVLDGSIQRAGDRIRGSARLLKVRDGTALWAGTFDEKFTDVFTLQDRISERVMRALALRLSAKEKARLTRRDTDNVQAYQLYLTGRYHWLKLTPPEIAQSIEFFRQAIEVDPNYALAYLGLADAYSRRAITSDVPSHDTFPQAKAAALKAVEIDESLAEPHATLALIHMWFDWDWVNAEQEGERAIKLNPNSGFAHVAYAHVLSNLGRHEEAIVQATRSRELDPVSLIINAREGAVLFSARRYDDARERLQKTIELDQSFWVAHFFLGHVFLQQEKYQEALAELSKAKEFSRGNSQAISMIGCAWVGAGDAGKARGVLEELKALSAERYIPSSNIAALFLALGEPDEAIAWLEKAFAERDVRLSFLKIDPKWDPLRTDPRFVAFLKRIGL